jgi:hypothetical protein
MWNISAPREPGQYSYFLNKKRKKSMGFTSVVDRHSFDAYPDPIFHFDADPDPNPTPRFTHGTK